LSLNLPTLPRQHPMQQPCDCTTFVSANYLWLPTTNWVSSPNILECPSPSKHRKWQAKKERREIRKLQQQQNPEKQRKKQAKKYQRRLQKLEQRQLMNVDQQHGQQHTSTDSHDYDVGIFDVEIQLYDIAKQQIQQFESFGKAPMMNCDIYHDGQEQVTLHRLASTGSETNVFVRILNYCTIDACTTPDDDTSKVPTTTTMTVLSSKNHRES
jgi:hypothetical protein